MSRYRLDDLGCFQFEELIQALLKVLWGLAIESWGTQGDYGRDAFYSGDLRFPDGAQECKGPFLFQVKFVEHANAAGARPDAPLLAAVRKERLRIEARRAVTASGTGQQQRIRSSLAGKTFWSNLQHYVVLTNAPLSPEVKLTVESIIRKSLPKCRVYSFGANDICDFLDNHPTLRRAFPQLLSLRDLDELIGSVLDRESINRSKAAIDQARETCRVFVPTSAFARAWDVLREHNFAVLEGPPEMGKTAIAKMIALTQASLGWESIVCNSPTDVFQRLSGDKKQIFVADDAFGRTEYDPGRGKRWEQSLDLVLRSLDAKHWLIWTSRKHILERALRAMDLEAQAKTFPSPGAVMVDASSHDLREKALILFRHARERKLVESAKAIVRGTASLLVDSEDFTPERIRRFVDEDLPEIRLSSTGSIKRNSKAFASLCQRITRAIRNPTERMRKTFTALPEAHKWFLISLLEAGAGSDPNDVSDLFDSDTDSVRDSVFALYEAHCPRDERRPATEVFDELRESFVSGEAQIDWMHPSYRDLVIDELRADSGLQHGFLSSMGLSGIKLAISDTGGKEGERRFPLMNLQDSWEILETRCIWLARNGRMSECVELMTVLESSLRAMRDNALGIRMNAILTNVCEEARHRWNASREPLSPADLDAYVSASIHLRPLPPMPILDPSWAEAERAFRKELKQEPKSVLRHPLRTRLWLRMVRVILRAEPRLLRQIGFPSRNASDITRLAELVAKGAQWGEWWEGREALLSKAEDTEAMAGLLIEIADLAPNEFAQCRTVANDLIATTIPDLQRLAAKADPEEVEEEDFPEDYRPELSVSKRKDRFALADVERLFRDL